MPSIDAIDPSLIAAMGLLFVRPQGNRPNRHNARPRSSMAWSFLLVMIMNMIVCGLGTVMWLLPPGTQIDLQTTGGMIVCCAMVIFIMYARREFK